MAFLVYPLVVWGLAARLELPVLDALFLAALVSILPVLAVAQIPLALEARVERVPAYASSAATIAVLGLIAALLGYRRVGWEGLGLSPLPLGAWLAWTSAVTLAASGVVLALHEVRRRAGIRESPLLRELIPRTPREKRVFAGLSLAAGFGEEIAFRGYALAAFTLVLGWDWGAAVFTSALFGLLHAYQGPIGMARTTLLGFVLAASLLLSGSLWPAIAAHVALDLLGGLVWGERLTE